MSTAPSLIAINQVPAGHAADFEQWLRTNVVPAVLEHRPQLMGRWQVLRAPEEDGAVVFVFLFHGDDASEWQLQPLLELAHGPETAERLMREFSGLLADGQYGWELVPVDLTG